MRTRLLTLVFLLIPIAPARGEITRVWLTHRSDGPSRIVVNWQTAQPGDSVVRFGTSPECRETAAVQEQVTLHHVEIPIPARDATYYYRVSSGGESSAVASFKSYPTRELRVAVAADWQARPDLSVLLRDDPHLLLTAGDHIDGLYGLCGEGVKDCTRPYGELIDAYPELFRSTPLMPVLGNHDRQIRPAGPSRPRCRFTTSRRPPSARSSSYPAMSGNGGSTCPSSVCG